MWSVWFHKSSHRKTSWRVPGFEDITKRQFRRMKSKPYTIYYSGSPPKKWY